MDFKQLQSYVTVVKYKSFTIAAEMLGTSQPTISTHIRILEEELNSRLLIRTARSFEITPRGWELYECAQNILKLREDMINRWNEKESKVIQLGVSTIPSAYILPEVLPEFGKLHSDVYFVVNQSDSQGIIDAVHKGSYDVGLVGMKTEDELLEFQSFYQDRMVLITPINEHYLSFKNQKYFPLESLIQEPFIVREEGSGSRKTASLFLKKMGIQEEFFHTFNALYEAGRQIVLTSDRPPKEMNTLEDRMKTRFEWGLLADIQPPDFETRVAIINAKASKLGFELPKDVIYCIAENLQSNVRQLEGTVKKIKAKHELGGEAITIDMTQKVIEEVKSINPGLNPTPPMILQTVSNFYSVPVDQILSDRRSKDTVQPRQMAMYLVRKMTNYSLPEIGKVFGRDHTTVMHACDKIDGDRKKNAELEDIIKTLIENIQNL